MQHTHFKYTFQWYTAYVQECPPKKYWLISSAFLPYTLSPSPRYPPIFLFLWIFLSWRRKWQPTPVLSAGKSHGWRSLIGYNPWGLQRVGHDWVTLLLPLLDISYEWNYIINALLWVASSTVFKVHLCCRMCHYFIAFYYWVIFHGMDVSHFIYPFIRW